MARRNFAQILREAGISHDDEYSRLYEWFMEQENIFLYGTRYSLREICESDFMVFEHRGTCTSLEDFDRTYNFDFTADLEDTTLDKLLLFAEYSYNLLDIVYTSASTCEVPQRIGIDDAANQYAQQVERVMEKIGYMKLKQDDITVFVPKKPNAVAVSEIVSPEISYKVLEYNHYMMKGDIARKRETLRILADQLEPRRTDLTAINKELASNVFFMFNNMNIRHNNCAEGDKNYKETVAKMSKDELENWYDETYQLCLLAFLELDNVERTKKVSELKASFGK